MTNTRRLHDGIMIMGLPGTGKTSFLCSTAYMIQRGGLTAADYVVHQSGEDRLSSLAGMPVIPAGKFLNDLFNGKEGEYWQPTDPYALPRILHLCRIRARSAVLSFDVWTVDMPGETWRMLSGQRDGEGQLDDQRRSQLAQIRAELLPRTSAFVLLLDAAAEESTTFWQSSWFEEIYQQTPHLQEIDVPVPLSFVLTKTDLLLAGQGFLVDLPVEGCRYHEYLQKRNLLGDRDISLDAGRARYRVKQEWFIESSQAVDAAEAEAIAWDMLRIRAPSSFEAVAKLAEDGRFEVGVHAVSAWGRSLPKGDAGVDVVPSLEFIRPARVLDPVVRMLDNLVFRRRTENRLKLERSIAIGLLALLMAGPVLHHGADWLAARLSESDGALGAYRTMKVVDHNPYGWLADRMAPAQKQERSRLKLKLSSTLAAQSHVEEAVDLLDSTDSIGVAPFLRHDAETRLEIHAALVRVKPGLLLANTPTVVTHPRVTDEESSRAFAAAHQRLLESDPAMAANLRARLEEFQSGAGRVARPALGREMSKAHALAKLGELKTREFAKLSPNERAVADQVLAAAYEATLHSADAPLVREVRQLRLQLADVELGFQENNIVRAGLAGTPAGRDQALAGLDSVVRLGLALPELESRLIDMRGRITANLAAGCYERISAGDAPSLRLIAEALKASRAKLQLPSEDAAVLTLAAALLAVRDNVRAGAITPAFQALDALARDATLWASGADDAEKKAWASVGLILREIAAAAADYRRDLQAKAESDFAEALLSLELQKIALRQAGAPALSEKEDALARTAVALKKIGFRVAGGRGSEVGGALAEIGEIWQSRRALAESLPPADMAELVRLEDEFVASGNHDLAVELLSLRHRLTLGFVGSAGTESFELRRTKFRLAQLQAVIDSNQAQAAAALEDALRPWRSSPAIRAPLVSELEGLIPAPFPEGAPGGLDWRWMFHVALAGLPGNPRPVPERVQQLLKALPTANDELAAKRLLQLLDTADMLRARLPVSSARSLWELAADRAGFAASDAGRIQLLQKAGRIAATHSGLPEADRRTFLSRAVAIVDDELGKRQAGAAIKAGELVQVHASALQLSEDSVTKQFIDRLALYLAGLDQMIFVAGSVNRSGGFYLSPYESTVEEYRRFLSAGYYWDEPQLRQPGDKSSFTPEDWERQIGKPQLPVVGLDFFDAWAFARWQQARLPSVAEWRLAAYGGVRDFPWGSSPAADTVNARAMKDARAVAGSGDRTPDGVSFMGGNAMEWAWSSIEELQRGQARIMGASWKTGASRARADNEGERASLRARRNEVGVRLVKDARPQFLQDWLKQNPR